MEKKNNFKARRWGRKPTITSFSLILGRLWAFTRGGWPEGHVQEVKIQGNRHPLNLLCSISPRLLGVPCLVQRLRVRAPDAGGEGLISDQGTKDPKCLWSKKPHKQAKKKQNNLTTCHPSLRARAPHGKGSHKWGQVSLCQQMLPMCMTVLAWISAGASIRGNCCSVMTALNSPSFSLLQFHCTSGPQRLVDIRGF